MTSLLAMAGAAALALASARPAALADAPADEYIAAHHRLERREISVQQFFLAATRLRDQLLAKRESEPTLLERLDPRAYLALERRLAAHGIVVNREEIVFAAVEPAFFLDLAKKYGDASDREFFAIYGGMYPPGKGYIWPAYVEQQTDASGCTSFAPHKLVDLYGRWQLYRSRFPGDYRQAVAASIQDVESRLCAAGCACEDRETVAAELRTFLARFPRDKIASQVTARLRDIEAGRSTTRFHCLSG
jgi:hypothetical protein